MTRMCCVCRKVEYEEGWKDGPVSHFQTVSHVYCPPCYEDLMDEIDRYASQKSYKSIYTIVHAGQSGEA